jgi:hypothetical protein
LTFSIKTISSNTLLEFKKQKPNIFFSSDVSHLFLIDPLVETLFDNEQWKDYWYVFVFYLDQISFDFSRYNKIIPRLHATQLSAAMGINRMLVLTHMIDTPLVMKTEDDSININHRQVILFD